MTSADFQEGYQFALTLVKLNKGKAFTALRALLERHINVAKGEKSPAFINGMKKVSIGCERLEGRTIV